MDRKMRLVFVFAKNQRNVETLLKIPSQTEEGSDLDIGITVTVLCAHIIYLQVKFAALLVKGCFVDNTSQFFPALQKGTSG